MTKRLPYPPGSPARKVHERLLSARRSLLKSYEAMRRVDLDEDERQSLLEDLTDARRILGEIRNKLDRVGQ